MNLGRARDPLRAGRGTGLALVVAAAVACAALLALVAYLRRPENALLIPQGGAEWVRASRTFELVARPPGTESVLFRHSFPRLESAPTDASLHVQALRAFQLKVNGREVGGASADESSWRYPRSFDLAPYLVSGTNELLIDVENDSGPPVLLAWSPGLGIATHTDWETQGPGGIWHPTMTASEARTHPISQEYPSAWRGLRSMSGLLIVAFALGAGASLAQQRFATGAERRWRLRPAHVRWLIAGALALLCLHNLTQLHIEAGFDARQHFDYIRYVVVSHRVPLANQGWQTFQPPLFYFLAAPPYLVVARLASEQTAMLFTRVLMLFCGLALMEMVYRAARAVFPAREDLQIVATAAGGFLPMTVYMSHYVSNEPLAAALTAALIAACFHLLAQPAPRLDRWSFGLGLLFGLALLAKVTVALLLPLLVALLFRVAHRQGLGLRGVLDPLVRFTLASGGVAGWYFARNWILMGSPYVGGWDPSRGVPWIQDPGYRVPEDLLTFGASLRYPIYAGLSSIWDGIYSTFWLDGLLGSSRMSIGAPPWHYHYVVACALLALPLTAAGIAGVLRSLRVPRNATQDAVLFSSVAVGIYLAAMLILFVRLPVFSTVKSSYTMGLAPCYGVLFAWGADLLPRRAATRAILAGYLTAWLAFVFRAYFR